MIDMNEIARLNKRYKFKIKQINDYICYVDDGVGEWLIEVDAPPDTKKKNIILRHKNYRRNKDGWHIQARYYDYVWVLGAIYNHQQKPLRRNNHLFKMKDKFQVLGL